MRAKRPSIGSMPTGLATLLIALAVSPAILPAGTPDRAIVLSTARPTPAETRNDPGKGMNGEPLPTRMGPFTFSPHLIDRFWTPDSFGDLIDRDEWAALPQITIDLVTSDSSISSDEPALFSDAEWILTATLEEGSTNLGIALTSTRFDNRTFDLAGPRMAQRK